MPKSPRTYNNNRVYPLGGVTQKREKDARNEPIRPAMKKGPQPTDMGSTSAKAQTARFFKGSQSGGM